MYDEVLYLAFLKLFIDSANFAVLLNCTVIDIKISLKPVSISFEYLFNGFRNINDFAFIQLRINLVQ